MPSLKVSVKGLPGWKVVEQLGQQGYSGITYFDYLLMIALCWYKDRAVDYVVVETGLGGRLD